MALKKCKNCDGKGYVKIGYMWNGIFFNTAEKKCKACNGKGVIEVNEEVVL
ncbi:MAG: hypothetical protein ACTSYC_12350 [Promethearchaeota archaeon]